MLQILSITTPIFALIVLGFLAVQRGFVSGEQIRGMGSFVINLALPAMVLRALLESSSREVLNWQYLLAYGVGSLVAFSIGLGVFRLRRETLDRSAITALGMASSNSGFLGYPIIAMMLGSTAAVGLAMNLMVENLLIVPLALALGEAGQQRGKLGGVLRETARRLLKTPLIISMLIGMPLVLLGWHLPAVPNKVIDMLAGASAPVALFVIGGTLYGLKLEGLFSDISLIAVGKLVLHPLAVLLIFLMLPDVDPLLMMTGVIYASAPMLSVYPILGQRFGVEGRCAAALLLTTATSFFTLSATLGLVATRL